jgi:hypothetical protein
MVSSKAILVKPEEATREGWRPNTLMCQVASALNVPRARYPPMHRSICREQKLAKTGWEPATQRLRASIVALSPGFPVLLDIVDGTGQGEDAKSTALRRSGLGVWLKAGVDGSRTHQGLFCTTPQTVLKTARGTGRDPPPGNRIHPKDLEVKLSRPSNSQYGGMV